MPAKKPQNDKDRDGVKYKHPERTCKECAKYPCFDGIEKKICDFAKYGCINYRDDDNNNDNNDDSVSDCDTIVVSSY